MKHALGLALAVSLILLSPSLIAAPKATAAARNLEWAALTLDKIEKDLAEVIEEHKLTDTNALATAFQTSRGRIAVLKKAIGVTASASDAFSKSMDFSRNISSAADSLFDRISDLNAKRESYRKLTEENPILLKTDIGTRFNEGLRLQAGLILRVEVCQLGEKPLEANEAEGELNLQAMRCEQILDTGWDEGGYLNRKEEMVRSIREGGKSISLAPLDEVREKVRAVKRQQHELAIEKQKQANQISHANLQSQLLDQQTEKLSGVADEARQAFDEVQEKIQQSIDE